MNVQLERQFNRTSISIKDLDQAIKYLIRLNEIPVNSSDFEVRSALLVAAIISYSRPFSGNSEDEFATGTPKFGKNEQREIKDMIGEEAIAFHKMVIDLRNKAIAHSEYKKNPTRRLKEYPMENGFLTISRHFDILSVDLDTSYFLKLAEAVKKVLVNKLYTLNKSGR